MLSDLAGACEAVAPSGPFFGTLALALAACKIEAKCDGVSQCTTVGGTGSYVMSLGLEKGRRLQAAIVCIDSCRYATDGDCDDGGPGAEYYHCSLGFDCTDCGSRAPSPPLLPPSPPPDITFNPGTVSQNLQTLITVSGAGISVGDTLVFLRSVRLRAPPFDA